MSSSSDPGRTRPARRSRLLASLAYVGPLSLVIVALLPRSRFVLRHALIAMAIHLARLLLAGTVASLWIIATDGEGRFSRIAADLGSLLLFGLPWPVGWERDLLLVLSFPLGLTWLLTLGGLAVAATGHSLDLRALFQADWPDAMPKPVEAAPTQFDERAYARELRERQLERIWNASMVAQSERRRQERIEQVKGEMDLVLGRLDYLNHLLSFGELSLSRFNAMHAELIAYLDALRAELADVQWRWGDAITSTLRPSPPLALTETPQVHALTLAVLDQGGVPIFTTGYFPLEESLITGMISALESLSEEMFGSRVHKSQLAEGQVVHFVRGTHTIAYAIFEDEPAPVQIGQLREFLDAFEQENAELLANPPVDPAQVTAVPLPFEFLRRLPAEEESTDRSAAVSSRASMDR